MMVRRPKVRKEGLYLISRSRWRLLGSRFRYAKRQLACALFDHAWSEWLIDDYEGPGEYLDGDPDSFMPYCSRPSRRGEFGTRTCRRYCGVHETRYPVDEAPAWWRRRAGC